MTRLIRKVSIVSMAAVAIAAAFYVGLVCFVTGSTPREYIASWIYPEVGFLERVFEPEGKSIEFQNRVFEKRSYALHFVVHATKDTFLSARNAMERTPFGDRGRCGEPTTFNVVFRSPAGSTLYEKTITAHGVSFHGPSDIGREIVAIVLDPGVYAVSVTPIGDFSKLKALSTSFSINFGARPKSTPIFSDRPAATEERLPNVSC